MPYQNANTNTLKLRRVKKKRRGENSKITFISKSNTSLVLSELTLFNLIFGVAVLRDGFLLVDSLK